MVTLARVQFNPSYVIDLKYRQGYYLGYVPTNVGDPIDMDDAQRLVQKHPTVTHGMNLLSLEAIGKRVYVTCEDKQLEYIVNYMLDSIDSFLYARKTLVQTGTLFGLSLQQKFYHQLKIPGYEGTWEAVQKLQEVDKKRLRLERDVNDRNKLYWTLWSPQLDKYIILEDKNENPNAADENSLQGYLWYAHSYEEDKPYFAGLADVLYPLVRVYNNVYQYWAELCETWSGPMFIATMDSDKLQKDSILGDGVDTYEESKDKMILALQNMRNKRAIVTDKSDNVKVIEHGSTGNNIHKEMLEYTDKKITLCILGTELTTQSGKSGSYALGKVHETVTSEVIQYAQNRMLHALYYDLIDDFILRNWKTITSLGMSHVATPITVHVEKPDAEEDTNDKV